MFTVDEGSITDEILRAIRDDIALLRKETNARFDEVNERFGEVDGRIDEVNGHLDTVVKWQGRMATDLIEVHEKLEKLDQKMTRQERRFDHFLDTAGGEIRRLDERVTALESDDERD